MEQHVSRKWQTAIRLHAYVRSSALPHAAMSVVCTAEISPDIRTTPPNSPKKQDEAKVLTIAPVHFSEDAAHLPLRLSRQGSRRHRHRRKSRSPDPEVPFSGWVAREIDSFFHRTLCAALFSLFAIIPRFLQIQDAEQHTSASVLPWTL